MPRSTQEQETRPFDCPQLGDTAYVELTYLGMSLGNGESVRTLSKFHCEDSKQCGVATAMPGGRGWTYEWAKCVHPEVAKRS